jgi:hypothetical protein
MASLPDDLGGKDAQEGWGGGEENQRRAKRASALGFGRVYMKPFSIDQISAIHLISRAQIIHGLNRPAGFSGPKAKLRPKPSLEG